MKTWPRIIVHADLNHCYAQIEEMKCPELVKVPMIVGGDESKRHGIVLAKNDLAKACGIKTAETLRDAYKKCPELLVVPPHYDDYLYYTEKVKDIYRRYTNRVESFGLDEAWIDLTHSQSLYGDALALAHKIQEEIDEELGLKVSMGISFNKIFAKLGSDMDKKKGFTVISPENYQELIFPLPVEELLYVGVATKRKLNAHYIYKIGDLAKTSRSYLRGLLGKNGEMIWAFANGLDLSVVEPNRAQEKSIGNGVTAVRDLKNFEDLKMIVYVLSESIAARLKEKHLVANEVAICLRNAKLESFSRQISLGCDSNLAEEIAKMAMHLAYRNIDCKQDGTFITPFRTVTISVSKIKTASKIVQLDLFEQTIGREKEARLEQAVEIIRNKYGFDKAKRLVMKMDESLTDFNPKDDHIIHPESWF